MSKLRTSVMSPPRDACRGTAFSRLVFVCLGAALLAACHPSTHGPKADRLLHELAPGLRLGETLAEARRALPSLDVRHPGDSADMYQAFDSEPPRPVAVVVWPRPAAGERASPMAVVEAVELVMGGRAAARMRQRASELFGESVQPVCAGRSIDHTDLVMVWEPGGRGGVLLTFPERRPEGVVPASRLFIYGTGWEPARAISGFGQEVCSALQ